MGRMGLFLCQGAASSSVHYQNAVTLILLFCGSLELFAFPDATIIVSALLQFCPLTSLPRTSSFGFFSVKVPLHFFTLQTPPHLVEPPKTPPSWPS